MAEKLETVSKSRTLPLARILYLRIARQPQTLSLKSNQYLVLNVIDKMHRTSVRCGSLGGNIPHWLIRKLTAGAPVEQRSYQLG